MKHQVPEEYRMKYSKSFYVIDLLFRKLLRQNRGIPWPVHHTTTIRSPHKIKAGINAFPGDSPGMYINADNGIEIGHYTNIAPNVGLISANHDPIRNELHLPGPPLKIGRFCWIGMGAIILPGVQLGDFTVVGAGAIVTKSFPEGHCIIAGNPAKLIRTLDRKECEAAAAEKYRHSLP